MSDSAAPDPGGDQMADVAVIGGGPGGYVAALRAAQLGGSVVLVERDAIGGVCLNEGCIPTKARIETAARLYELTRQQDFGIEVHDCAFDYARARQREVQVVQTLVRGVEQLLRTANVRVLRGSGRFLDRQTVEVKLNEGQTEQVKARKIIIATGSVPASPPVPGLEQTGDGILFNRQALELDHVPKSILVLGAGPVGLEFAQIYARLGAEVTLVEMLPSIAPTEDPELSRLLDRILRREKIKIMTGSRLTRVEEAEGGLKRATVAGQSGEQEVTAECILVAVGRRPNTEGLGPEAAGVQLVGTTTQMPAGYGGAKPSGPLGIRIARGAIQVDDHMETNVPGIYAVGDVTGGWLLAHVAFQQGEVAAENALGHASTMDYKAVPRVIYTRPEVASVGLTEAQASESGRELKIGRFPLAANGRALTMGESVGLVKIVAEARYGEVLGIHILAPEAGEMLSETGMAMELEATLDEYARLMHPHPTVSETIREAALSALGRPLHIAAQRSAAGRSQG